METRHFDIFGRSREATEAASNEAIQKALVLHKRAGNPVAVERDGELVILQPEEIDVD